ncbi:MAG TPA: DUF255 domain-containing protein, partial [Fimbriimonas sp.]|nr:DUF255 domain-containing protein [Fimbriimonas sp.]
KPVFLSVGYSSCHWCHVMEHESFEDEDTARLLNEHFICVKVDREERPDIDEAYMAAVQMTSGRGGWPMSVFVTPDRKPFFAGTYFPKEDRGQHIGFKSILAQVVEAWRSKRGEIQKAADQLATAIGENMGAKAPGTFSKLDMAFVTDCVRAVLSEFDQENGGFGKAPKFPPHSALELLTLYALQDGAPEDLRQASMSVVAYTLERMVLGGIHDHVGGGFHRYSTDEKWLLPHFEKMLYDNALMVGNLGRAAGILHEIDASLAEMYLAACQRTIDWLDREMTAPASYFYSALDADSEGEEGKFYVWSDAEVREVLGEQADDFLAAYNFAAEGNFKDEATHELSGANIPHLQEDRGAEFDEALAKLRMAREHRVHPGLDDKALVSWNGLMIGGLAEVGMGDMAAAAALSILKAAHDYGELPHQIAKGRASGTGYLEDYAAFADGLLKLAAFTGMQEERGQQMHIPAQAWVGEALRLKEEMVARFWDEENGGFFSTSDRHEMLFGRSKPIFDQPIPSGNALALRVLVALGDVELAQKTVNAFLGWVQRVPNATEAFVAAALPLLNLQPLVATAGPDPTEKASAPAGEVKVSISARELQADSMGKAETVIRIEIPEGLHINSSSPPARWLSPTKVEARPVKAEARYPEATNDQYTGTVEIPVTVHLDGKEAEFEVVVSYQPCTDTECHLAAEKRFDCVIFR